MRLGRGVVRTRTREIEVGLSGNREIVGCRVEAGVLYIAWAGELDRGRGGRV